MLSLKKDFSLPFGKLEAGRIKSFFFLDSTFEEFTKICKPIIIQNTLHCKQNTHYIYSVPVTAC